MTEYEKNTVRYEDNNWRYWKESKESAVDVSLGSVDKTIRIFTDKYNGYSGRHNFLLNMGYKNYSAGTMTLTFSMPGEYTFDDLYVVCQPMASVEEQTEELEKKVFRILKRRQIAFVEISQPLPIRSWYFPFHTAQALPPM